MPANYQNIQKRLQAFDFTALFTQELMWNHYATRDLEITLEGVTYILRPVARRGMAVFECLPPTDAEFPDSATRRKIDDKVSKTAREHIVIFRDHAKSVQWWQWVKREAGKPSATRSQSYYKGQSGDALVQKLLGIAFELEDEPNVLEDVAKVRSAFDLEKVTKKFYEQFKKEHDAFLKFTKGIPDEKLQRWYASVMLNRLMFIYFIQKKGFLGGDDKYLANRLTESQLRGRDRFYRDLLCPLFFEGFAKREEQRTAKTKDLLGAVPYLNGGLFLKHQIELKSEHDGKPIEVPDKAFERIFGFFEQFDWHLDDRPTRTGREINPDVLGYVFEKYINQKEMGAYYTKEDITEYISKNTIIPALFDMAKKSCRMAFEGEHSIWRLLQLDPDRYIYAAVEHGIWDDTVAAVSDRRGEIVAAVSDRRPVVASVSDRREDGDQRSQPQAAVGDRRYKPLPPEIMEGIKDVSKRTLWNKPVPPEYALPTETWREVVARRTRCEEIRNKLAAGEIRSINDLITYNLDIRRFAEEVIANCEGPELLRAFYKAIRSISVLDPACGSGAFLFAALNILEKLYDACLARMQEFVDDLDRSGEKHSPEKFKDFRQTLDEMNDKSRHPSPRYFILKSIILNNLYGVDSMEEATEICKLRLFLKLVSQVNPAEKIEPLPDIDFNIRAGNTLVGYATEPELDKALSRLGHADKKAEIEEKAEAARLAFERFRQQQVVGGTGSPEDMAGWKADVNERLGELRQDLDDYLAGDYNVKKGDKAQFSKWREAHQPFHWFVEFFGIMRERRFDVIIGNPPYVEYTKVKATYTVKDYATLDCSNLYAFFCERSATLLRPSGRFGMIVPLSIVSTERMQSLRQLFERQNTTLHISNYSGDAHPAILFNGVKMRLSIIVSEKRDAAPTAPSQLFSTGFIRWYSEARSALFHTIRLAPISNDLFANGLIPKASDHPAISILQKIKSEPKSFGQWVLSQSRYSIFAHRIVAHFIKCFDFVPFFKNDRDGEKKSEDYKVFAFPDDNTALVASAILNSSLFYFYYLTYSDAYHCGRELILNFPCDLARIQSQCGQALIRANHNLMTDLRKNAVRRRIHYHGTGRIEYDEFYPKRSKGLIDEIDHILYGCYGLSAGELDYVLNFDVKFRLGQEDEEYEEQAGDATN